MKKQYNIFCITLFIILLNVSVYANVANPTNLLASWNDGPVKTALIKFAKMTTDKSSPNYIPPDDRIATFDQDGTLWVEQPMYTQITFAFDRINELTPMHPEWKNIEPFKSVIAKDKAAMAKFSMKDLDKIIAVTHAGMTTKTFESLVKKWLKEAKDPRWQRPYTELVYQPMLELINFLQAHGYKIYIVTGAGQNFVRAYAKKVYNIPPEQIIGSAFKLNYSYDTKGNSVLTQTPKILINNNFEGKPEAIYLFIGRKPQVSFGNSTGDQQMLEYVQSGKGANLVVLVYHDDPEREYAYGVNSKIGLFSESLRSEANRRGWLIISMKKDWKRIFAFDRK